MAAEPRTCASASALWLFQRGTSSHWKPIRPSCSPAPFYIGSILKDARRFLDQHRATLEKVPLALTVFGPITKGDMAEDRKQLDALQSKMPWLKPVAAEMFVGKYNPAVLQGLDKFIARLSASPFHDKPMQDKRDWDAIRAWASTLPTAFRLQP